MAREGAMSANGHKHGQGDFLKTRDTGPLQTKQPLASKHWSPVCLPCTSDTLAIPKAVICFHDTILPGAWRYPPPFSLRNYCFPVLRQTFYAARVVKHWCRFSREAVESSFLEIFKTCLDLVLNTAPAGLAPSKGPDWTISQKYLPASTTLQFCDLSFSLSPLMVSVNTLKAAALPQEARPCSLSATAL